MTNNIKIDEATNLDIESIENIIYQRCIWLDNQKISQWNLNSYPIKYNKNYFKHIMKDNKLLVDRDSSKVIGVVLLKSTDIDHLHSDDKKALYIHHLATLPSYKGLGKLIINYCENFALKNSKSFLRLDCVRSNIKLNKYYENLGFKIKGHGEIKKYKYNLRELNILKSK